MIASTTSTPTPCVTPSRAGACCQGALAAAAAAAAGGGASAWAAQRSARKQQIILPPGTRPFPNHPEGIDTLPKIHNIVIYMQENHSFDSYYGVLGRGDGFSFDAQGNPVNSNPDLNGDPVKVFHQESTCNPITGDHSWDGEHLAWNNGAMDGFVRANNGATNILGYYDADQIPFYYGLAKQFPICDRWFSSVMGPTHPNRRYLQAATSAGMVNTSVAEILEFPTAPNGTIWERFDDLGITWKDYQIDIGDIWLWPGPNIQEFLKVTANNRAFYPSDFLRDCLNGTLPQVSIIAPGVQNQYDEGSQDVQNGEAYSYSIINAVMASPQWAHTALFFTYDESGGCYDHVPPPAAIAPDDIPPRITVPPDQPGAFAQYGVRVPGFVISPWAKREPRLLRRPRPHVDPEVHRDEVEHRRHDVRDANADNLLDCFDFHLPGFVEPPVLAAARLARRRRRVEPQPRPPLNPLPPRPKHHRPHPTSN